MSKWQKHIQVQGLNLVNITVIACVLMPTAIAQDYKPGQPIKFSSDSTTTTNSSFSGTTYTSPSGSSPTSPTAASAGGASSGSAAADSQNGGEAQDRGLGWLMQGVKHEFKSTVNGLNNSNRFRNGYSAGPQFQNGYSAGPQFSNNQNASMSGLSAPVNYGHMPDGTYRPTRPDAVSNNEQTYMPQKAPRMHGDAIGFVTSNMPSPITSNVESLMPRELHAKAYGPELLRNAPLNGAEGYPPAGF
jgi:hypothetical protein